MVGLLPAFTGVLPPGTHSNLEESGGQRSAAGLPSSIQRSRLGIILMADEVKGLDRRVAGFEVIDPPQFQKETTFTPLIAHPEIQHRLHYLAKQTLECAKGLASEKTIST